MNGVHLRAMAVGDLPEVAALEAAAFADPWPEVAFADFLALGHTHAIVARDASGQLVGYALSSLAADEGEVLNIAVAEPERRGGIGAALLASSLEWLAGQGAAHVYLEVRRSNLAAIALYERAGFTTLRVRKRYYRMPTEDAVVMGRPVGGVSARK